MQYANTQRVVTCAQALVRVGCQRPEECDFHPGRFRQYVSEKSPGTDEAGSACPFTFAMCISIVCKCTGMDLLHLYHHHHHHHHRRHHAAYTDVTRKMQTASTPCLLCVFIALNAQVEASVKTTWRWSDGLKSWQSSRLTTKLLLFVPHARRQQSR